MKRKYAVIIFLVSWLCGFASHAAETLHVAVFDDQLRYFEQLLADSDCPALHETDVGTNLMLAEYLVMCNLITQQFPETRFKLVGLPIVPRVAEAIENGNADISGFGIWSGEASSFDVLKSGTVMGKGEFAKGLFTLRDKRDLMGTLKVTDLKKYVAVSNRNWTYDWAALNCAGFSVAHVDKYENMFQMVMLQRADFLPLGFGNNADLSITAFGIQLFPVSGVKLEINDSSHYLVSNKSTKSLALLTAINEGLAAMRQSGELRKLQIKVGAIHPTTETWRPLCGES